MAERSRTQVADDWQSVNDWQDVGATTPAPAPANTNEIHPAATGAKAWLNSLEQDIRTGSGFTAPGRILQAMGARGTDSGVSKGAADTVASLPLGTVKAAQGVAEKDPWKVLGGMLQAAEIPAAFAAPPGVKASIEAIPSKTWAGKAFQELMGALRTNHVDENAAGQAALKFKEVAGRGGSNTKVINDFLRRVTEPDQPPLTYEEARDFYSNATRLSADEMSKLKPNMRRLLIDYTVQLGKSLQDTANQAGMGDLYSSAMSNYKWGSRMEDAARMGAKYGLTTLGGTMLGKYLYDKLQKSH